MGKTMNISMRSTKGVETMEHLKRNWKRYALVALAAGATYYGGEGAGNAIREYVPKIFTAVFGG